jgi:hypothetical protein
MKRYLQKTLQDMLQIWVALEVGIVISAILYAVLKVEGVSENTSLLVAFIILVGFIVIGLGLFPLNSSRLMQSLKKLVLGEQKQVKQFESLVEEQNLLLEKLSRNIYISELRQERLVSAIVPPFEEFGRSVKLQRGMFQDLVDKQETVFDNLMESQRKEQAVLETIAYEISTQQKSLEQVLEGSQSNTVQKDTFEQTDKEQIVQNIVAEMVKLPERQQDVLLTAIIESLEKEPNFYARLLKAFIGAKASTKTQILTAQAEKEVQKGVGD